MANLNFTPDQLTELPFGLPGHIFRSPMPFDVGKENDTLFDQFKAQNIDIIVNLMPEDESRRKARRALGTAYAEAGMKMIGFPIQDYHIPDMETLSDALDQVNAAAKSGKNLVIHCHAGIGRTGTFLACLAVRIFGFQGEQAVDWVRTFIPHAVENTLQKVFVDQFGAKYADHKR